MLFSFVAIVILLFLSWRFLHTSGDTAPEAVVDRGEVTVSISVSGALEAASLSELGFPQPGRLSALLVEEGQVVETGELLATIGSSAAAADRARAVANLREAEANREALLNGLPLEERIVSSTTVEQARVAYENTIETETEKIAVAKASLYSTDLVARTTNPEEDTTAPIVSGSYNCEDDGSYQLDIYRSAANSGYSIRYSGLEEGVVEASFTQPVKLGECGLSLQFTSGDRYGGSEWSIDIPNLNSNTYSNRLRSLELTEQQAEANIEAAKYVYELAKDSAANQLASPRIEDLITANARVSAAQASVLLADAELEEKAIYAPFSGQIAKIHTAIGETTSESVIDLVANENFSLVARVPEIDIAKLSIGQNTEASFDAAANEQIAGEISFISPIATVIDGVSYFETTIRFNNQPDWFRDGLNADINVFLEKETDVLRLPNRFINKTTSGSYVYLKRGRNEVATTSISVTHVGSNGYSAISGINEGDIVIAR